MLDYNFTHKTWIIVLHCFQYTHLHQKVDHSYQKYRDPKVALVFSDRRHNEDMNHDFSLAIDVIVLAVVFSFISWLRLPCIWSLSHWKPSINPSLVGIAVSITC